MKYYTIHEFSQKVGVKPTTLRSWDKGGKLKPHHTSSNGYRYYSDQQLLEVSRVVPKQKVTIGYCRVSSAKQKDDLERQTENVKAYMIAKGYSFAMITDVGSGINYRKKGLSQLVDMVVASEVDRIVVLYKDRLLRFGYELLEGLCARFGVTIEIIDNTEKTEEQELVEDLVQIITVFSCKLQGKRANKAKKMIKELLSYDKDV